MMVDFADLMRNVDAQVDARLGDRVSYSTDGVSYVDVKAFIEFFDDDGTSFGAQDDIRRRVRLKIARDVVALPTSTHRVRSADKLGIDTYRPMNKSRVVAGRYWLVDLDRI
jgi:hypothetical protein